MILKSDELRGQSLRAGVCIVGAGAVGIAMALKLAEAGQDILLLEAAHHDDTAQDIYRGSVVNPAVHPPLDHHRERRLGGTTSVWGGRCVPYDPIDFESRPWMAESGWPIASDALARYYPEANRLCEAGEFAYTEEEAFPKPLRPVIAGFHGEAFTANTLERFSCPTNFGERYRYLLAASQRIRVVLHANVVGIRLNPEGTAVAALDVRTRGGEPITVIADEVVLASGGLESTRLLLASRDVHAEGIGNAHGVLGRYYMAHIAGTIGRFQPSGGRGSVWHGYEIAEDGTYCRRRLALRTEAQRAHGIGNFIARLHHTRIADPSHGSGVLSALRLGRAVVPQRFRTRLDDDMASASELARHAINVVRDVPAIARFGKQMLVKRRWAARKYPSIVVDPRSNCFSLDFHSEQEPNVHSRVRLSSEKDAFGMLRLEVDWRYTGIDVKTVETSLRLFAEDVMRSGAGRFDFDPDEVEREVTRYGAYGGHHIGTVRMGDDPKRSVVDANCRVHGVANLHVAGTAVFPTSSQANPTLTAVVIGLRLADHLRSTREHVPVATVSVPTHGTDRL